MSKTRLEAFSDGVIAILITIMVLELKVPHGTSWEALHPTIFTLLLYLMSFVFLGIYWSNHHHLLHATDRVNGAILWANLHLLFWLSLVPFVTTWMGENGFAALPTSIYGLVLLLSAIAYTILQTKIIKHQGSDSKLKSAVGSDFKGKISMLMYLAGIFPGVRSSPHRGRSLRHRRADVACARQTYRGQTRARGAIGSSQ